MKFLFKTFFFLFFALVVLVPLLAVWKAIDHTPYVRTSGPVSQQDLMRAREIIRANRPDAAGERQDQTLELSKEDMDLLLRYALFQAFGNDRPGSRVDLKNGLLVFHVSCPIPDTPLGRYVNTSLGISLKDGKPVIYAAQAGSLIIPGPIAQPAVALAHSYLLELEAYRAAAGIMDGVRGMRILPEGIRLSYSLDPNAIEQIKSKATEQLFPPVQQKRIKTYHNLLADTAMGFLGMETTLVDILPPLFAAAVENTRHSNDPIGENKALLQVLAAFASQRDMARFMPDHIRREMIPIPDCTPTLFNREDLAQHLLVSAGVAASASRRLADAIGLAKEMEDARAGGSGFSFADLAADKAGVRVGELATARPDQARRLQQRLRDLTRERDLMPDISDLPPPMSASEFKQRYQTTNSPAYKHVEDFIQAKLADCPVLQN